MSTVHIWYGTESGNAEMVAEEISDSLIQAGLPTHLTEMSDLDVTDLEPIRTAILITSTYGEGGLPASTEPFYESLIAQKPDLSHLRFAAFGLGDSSYENYNNGVRTLAAVLTDLGAERLGDIGHHDAISGLDPTGVAVDWVDELAPIIHLARVS